MAKVLAQSFKTITKLNDAIQIQLSHNIASIPCDKTGTPLSNALSGASVTISANLGDTPITSGLRIASITTSDATNVTASISNNVVTFTKITQQAANTGFVDITVYLKVGTNPEKNMGVYRFNYVKQLQGESGNNGLDAVNYKVEITGGVRGITYLATGLNPSPSGDTTYTATVYKNDAITTETLGYSWSCSGALTAKSGATTKSFTATVKSSITGELGTIVTISVTKGGNVIATSTIALPVVKSAAGVDWVDEWTGTETEINGNKVLTSKIFAGTTEGGITGVSIGLNVLNSPLNNINGIMGYNKGEVMFNLGLDGTLIVGSPFSATNPSGLVWLPSEKQLSIVGSVKISSSFNGDIVNSTIGDLISGNNKLNGVLEGDKVNGEQIKENSIKPAALQIYDGFAVYDKNTGEQTFVVTTEGEVYLKGVISSYVFTDEQGYKLNPDGSAILNNAKIRGDLLLPKSGMTNYGGQKGNNNLIANSNFTNVNRKEAWTIEGEDFYLGLEDGAYISSSALAKSTSCYQWITTLKPTTNYVISYKIKYTDIVRGTTNPAIGVYMSYCTESGAYVSEVSGLSFNGTGSTEWIKVEKAFTSPASGTWTKMKFAIYGRDFTGSVDIKEIKLEEGATKATDWCLSPLDQKKEVRIWSGESYNNRKHSPFMVLENGDLYAEKGIFNGQITGHIDTGNVHINDGVFQINDQTTFLDSNGNVSSIEPMDASLNPYVHLSKEYSFFNNNFNLGTASDRGSKISFEAGQFNFNEADLNFIPHDGTSLTWIKFLRNTGQYDGLNLMNPPNKGNGRHIFGYLNSSSVETLVIDSKNNRGALGDFAFVRKGRTEDVKVLVDGELEFKTKIVGSKGVVEMRSVSNGIAFYAI